MKIIVISDRSWMISHLLFQIPIYMFYSHVSGYAFDIFIPIQGRGGPASNPDSLIAVFCIAFGLLLTTFFIPLIGMCKRSLIMLCGFLLIFVVYVIVMFTPVGFPYVPEVSGQRFWIFVSC